MLCKSKSNTSCNQTFWPGNVRFKSIQLDQPKSEFITQDFLVTQPKLDQESDYFDFIRLFYYIQKYTLLYIFAFFEKINTKRSS